MLQDREDRRLVRDDVPFAPVVNAAPLAVSPVERALELSHRFRAPLTLLFGALIVGAAYFAYHTQHPTVSTAAPASTLAPTSDRLVSAVEGLSAGTTTTEGSGQGASTVSSDLAPLDPSDPSASGLAPGVDPGSATTVGSGGSGPGLSRSGTGATRGSTGGSTTSGAATTTAVGESTTATTQATTPTSPQATTSTSPATQPPSTQPPTTLAVFVGDKVSYDDWDGAGVSGLAVALQRDNDQNGVGESTRANTTTSSTGAFSFNVEPGCYVVVFTVPGGQSVLKGTAKTPVCLTSGQSNARIDLVISRPFVRPPPSCEVDNGNGRSAGVKVYDSSRAWAKSYAFYDASGKLLVSTSGLGPPDISQAFPVASIGWTSQHFHYEESGVASVAAQDSSGNTSTRVNCRVVRV